MLGVAGVDGNGQAELELALTGLAVPERGTIEVNGADVTGLRPRRALPLASPTSRRTTLRMRRSAACVATTTSPSVVPGGGSVVIR